jgi:hypothetical protein
MHRGDLCISLDDAVHSNAGLFLLLNLSGISVALAISDILAADAEYNERACISDDGRANGMRKLVRVLVGKSKMGRELAREAGRWVWNQYQCWVVGGFVLGFILIGVGALLGRRTLLNENR